MGKAPEGGSMKPQAELMNAELDLLLPGEWKLEILCDFAFTHF